MKKLISITCTIILVLLFLFGFSACDKNAKYKTEEEQPNDLIINGSAILDYKIEEEQFNDLILNGSAILSLNANVTIKGTQGIPEKNYIDERIFKIAGNLYSEFTEYNDYTDESFYEIQKENYDENSKSFSGFYYYKDNQNKWIKMQSEFNKERILSNCGFCFETWTFADFDFDEENKIYINNKTLYREGYTKQTDYGGTEHRPQVTFNEITLSFLNGKLERICYKADVGTSVKNAEFTLEFYDYGTTIVTLPVIE